MGENLFPARIAAGEASQFPLSGPDPKTGPLAVPKPGSWQSQNRALGGPITGALGTKSCQHGWPFLFPPQKKEREKGAFSCSMLCGY